MSEMNEVVLGKYRHYKGGDYEVIAVATHTETNEQLVVYRSLYNVDVSYWVRPLTMFVETVEVDGETKSRFEKITDTEVV